MVFLKQYIWELLKFSYTILLNFAFENEIHSIFALKDLLVTKGYLILIVKIFVYYQHFEHYIVKVCIKTEMKTVEEIALGINLILT